MQKRFSFFILLILCLPVTALAEVGLCSDTQTSLFTSINKIQSASFISPYVGQKVITEGVVTQVSQTHYSGFWMQQFDKQAFIPNASRGIFIYHTKHKVKVGDKVRLLGRVTEYHGLSEITSVEKLIVCEQEQALPRIKTISLPVASLTELEALEGMRVQLRQDLVISDLFGAGYGLGNYGQFAVSSKLHYQPTELFSPQALKDNPSLLVSKGKDLLLIDDGLAAAYPDMIPFPKPLGFSASNPLRIGDQLKEVTGVLHAYDEHYLLIPDFAKPFTLISSPRPEQPQLNTLANLRIVSFNLGNYFNGDGVKEGEEAKGFPTTRGASSYQGFLLQTQKLVAALAKMDADIIALMELENDGYGSSSAIAELTRALNKASGFSQVTSYEYIDLKRPKLGEDEISVGFLYRKNTVALHSPARSLIKNKRPSIAQVFSAFGKDFLVVVNHFKSKGRPCLSDKLARPLQGNCNQERQAASQQLIELLQQNYPASLPSLLVGDFNSYSQEQPLTTLYQAGFYNLKSDAQFSYSYQGYLGNLDHALANNAIRPYIISSDSWNINSVEDVLLDYRTEENGHPYPAIDHYGQPDAFRSSDHDPIIIELKF